MSPIAESSPMPFKHNANLEGERLCALARNMISVATEILSAQYMFRRIGNIIGGPRTAIAEMLKATEAAVVSRVSPREVNRVIDEHIIAD